MIPSHLRWNYHCEDVFALIDAVIVGNGIVVEQARVSRSTGAENLWVDQVQFFTAPMLEADAWGECLGFLFSIKQGDGTFCPVEKIKLWHTPCNLGGNIVFFNSIFSDLLLCPLNPRKCP